MIIEREILEVFPIPLADMLVTDKELLQGLEEEVYAEMERDPEGALLSNRGGWQSARHSNVGPLTQSLKDVLLPHVKQYYRECFRSKSTDVLKITGMWANVNPKNTYNTEHVHPGAQVSGVLYVKVPENPSHINFFNPNKSLKMAQSEDFEEINRYNSESYFFEPTVGRLLLFPSWLAHSVDISTSEGERISIAFNASYFARKV